MARIKAEGAGYYHCMSRVIERRHILQEREKRRLLHLMRSLAGFGGLHILSYCFMSNHFHILVLVPERQPVTDEELLRRLGFIMDGWKVESIGQQLRAYRQQGQERAAEALKSRFTYRMYDISEFFKAFKQQFSQSYNARQKRKGPLWEERFKSLLVEASSQALLTIAAYIDLNPVRAGMVRDPREYRYSSYGAAMGGDGQAREGLCRLMQSAHGETVRLTWTRSQQFYRQRLYMQGRQKGMDLEDRSHRQGFTPEQVKAVLEAKGQLPLHALLRCRVRYFSDGLVLGSREFADHVFERYRHRFGNGRTSGARPMQFGDWDGLCTLRHLRVAPISSG